jgi:cell division protein FtsL
MKLGGIPWLVVGIGVVALVSAILSVPVWMQNRYLDLMKERVDLEKERLSLEAEISKADMEIRQLTSLSRVEPIAKQIGLGFYALPTKVMEIPR